MTTTLESPSHLRTYILIPIALILVWSIALLAPPHYATLRPKIPSLKLSYPSQPPPFNTSKLALMIEDRPLGHIAPLLLHMISVLPSSWPFMFLGSSSSLQHVNASQAVKQHLRTGKLRLGGLEGAGDGGWSARERVNRLLTNRTFYEGLGRVEWLLVWQSDSVLCAQSGGSVDEWLEWDWVGAPWTVDARFGGSGGLSLRRVSKIKQVLSFQSRQDQNDAEDRWFVNRLGLLPGAKMANASIESQFTVEGIWHERPMGYHIGGSGDALPDEVWNDIEKRKRIYDYCPEIKLLLRMKLERERCEEKSGEKERLEAEAKAREEERKRLEEEEAKRLEEEEAARLDNLVELAIKKKLGGYDDDEGSKDEGTKKDSGRKKSLTGPGDEVAMDGKKKASEKKKPTAGDSEDVVEGDEDGNEEKDGGK